MFKFLKEAFKKFTKKAEEAPKEEKVKKEDELEKKIIKTGILSRITEVKLSEEKFSELFGQLEEDLLQNNVAYEIVDRLKIDLKEKLVGKSLSRFDLEKQIKQSLQDLVKEIFDKAGQIDLLAEAEKKKPMILMFVGVNGVGKTTSMAKLAKIFQDKNKLCVFAAADTFRAAAIEQLEVHANKLKIPIIKHKYGADAAAVAFDAIAHAKAKGIGIVLIDTAGRQHANEDLMAELAKVKRVAKPDLVIFVGDALTGNDCVNQAEQFNEKIGVDAIILSKTDTDEKGGALLSVAYSINKPVLFIGTGQKYTDLEPLNVEKFIKQLGL